MRANSPKQRCPALRLLFNTICYRLVLGWATPGMRVRISGTRARPWKAVKGKAAAEVLLINIRLFYFF